MLSAMNVDTIAKDKVNWWELRNVYQIRKGGVGRMSLIVEGISSMKEEDHGTMSMTEGEVSL